MKLVVVGVVIAVTGCGRSHFDNCGPPDAPPDAPPYANANIAFVTSTKHLPTTFGSDLAGADAICNARAADAQLPGTYVAWLSTAVQPAVNRLQGSRGWVRTDGMPFLDRPNDIALGQIYTPLNLDESGAGVPPVDTVITGTYGDTSTGSTCANWTDSAGLMTVGSSYATVGAWSAMNTLDCTTSARIYCFGVGKSAPLSIAKVPGRNAFLTVQTLTVDAGGLATADALCASDAQLGGLTGSYRAFLATSSGAAISRFSLSGPTWVRLDGIPIAKSPLELAAGNLLAPINLTPALTYSGGYVFTGANALDQPSGGGGEDCNDWTAQTTATVGVANRTDLSAFSQTSGSPCSGRALYCLEQ